MALNKSQLDEAVRGGCAIEGCGHDHTDAMFFHGRCHPEVPTWTSCSSRTGTVTVICSACRKPVVEIKVSDAPTIFVPPVMGGAA